MLRILLLVAEYTRLTGSQRYGLDLMAALQRRGHSVTVATVAEGPVLERAHSLGLDTQVVPGTRVFTQFGGAALGDGSLVKQAATGLRTLGGAAKIVPWVRRSRFDVVHMNTMRATLQWGPILRAFTDAQIVQSLRGRLLPYRSIKLIARSAHLTLAESALVQLEVKRAGLKRVVVLYPPLPAEFSSLDTIWEPASESSHRRYGLVGSLVPRKGIHVALQALAYLAREGEDCSLDILGDSDDERYEAYLRREASNWGIDDRVTFYGWIAEPQKLMVKWCCLLLPSLEGQTIEVPSRFRDTVAVGEGFPRVLLEAGSLGLHAVATPFSGAGEYAFLTGGATVVPFADAVALAKAAQAAPPKSRELSTLTRQRFAEEVSASRYEAVVASSLGVGGR